MDPVTLATVVTIIGTIGQILKVAPIVIETAADARPFLMALIAALLGRAPTDAEVAQLEASLADLSAQLQAPLPPQQDDDT